MKYQLNYFRGITIWLYVMVMIIPITMQSQNNSLIINGAYITMSGGSPTNSINLVVAQSSTLGIVRNGGGHIHSEGQYNFVKWVSGVSTGSYVLPFGVAGNAADYIPFTFNKTSSGNADISLSTWSTSVQNLPHPGASNVAAVSNMLGATDSVKNAIDRFWDIKTSSATTADLTFSYRGSENTTLQPGDTIRAQHWNGASWDAAVGVGKPGVTSGIGNTGSITGQSSFSPWVLTRSCISALPVNITTAANQQICNGNAANLTATASGTLSWYTAATGGTAIATGTVYTTPTLTTNTTYYVEQISVCGVSPSRTAITVTVNPVPVVTIGSVASSTICSGSSINLTSNGASTYTWTPALGLSTTTGSVVIANPTVTTIYQVTGTDASNCLSASANYTVSVNATPTVGLVSATSVTICSGTSTTITPTGASTYTLNPGALTGTGFTVSPTANTIYTITGSNASTGCISTAGGSGIVNVTVQASPTVGLASVSSTAICSGTSATIIPNGATSYTLNPGSVTGSTFVVSPLANTIYTITGTNGVTSCGSGSISAVTVTITVKATPTLGLVSAASTTICSGKSTTITPNGATTYTLNPGAFTGSSFTVSPVTTTVYTITGTDALTACTSNSATSVTASIVVNANPNANAGNDVTTCIGDHVNLTATGGGSYNWSNGANTATTVVTPTNTAYYSVTVTGTNSCVAKDSVKVTVITQSSVLAQNDSTSTSVNQSVNTVVSSNDIGSPNTVSVVIPPQHGVANVGSNGTVSYVPTTNYTGMDTLSYTICDATCSNFCSTAKLIIRVNREIVIVVPQWFSPNGDGKNDLFEIKDLNYYPDNELLIFNRWGDEVFFAKPYLNDWDGRHKGKGLVVSGTELVDGTYFYLLKLDKDSKPMKGYLELQRK